MTIPSKTDIERLRAELVAVFEKRARGDLNERSFQRTLAERTVDLYRATVQARLAKDEKILEEHHVIQSHFKVTQSILKEPEQKAVSLFATDRRLVRLRSVVLPNTPPRCDESDQTRVEFMPYDRIEALKVRRRIRPGEIITGVVIVGTAVLFMPLLSITGPFMALLGLLGVVHGLILPTRWVEVASSHPAHAQDPFTVEVLRKKSAKKLTRFLRDRIKAA